MFIQTKKGFTLVELIVVITILAILGTIAFISLQGYSSQSRDSVRISDMSRIKTGLELFQLDAGKYPIPTDGTEIIYSGGVVWTQGYFGESTYKNVGKLDKIPLDPLTDKKYVYSTTNTRQELQLAGVIEGDEVTLNRNITNAGTKTALVKISGNYNGKLLKVSTGGTDYVLAIPSIITNTGIVDIVDIVANDNLSYNGYKNLPYQYEGGKYNIEGDKGINLINNSDLVVYSGSLAILSSAKEVGINARLELLINMQNAYTGTTIKNVGAIARILSTESIDSDATELLTSSIVSNNLGGSIISGNNLTIITPAGPNNCKELLTNGNTLDGTYLIDPEKNGVGFNVYCDMNTELGGWTLVINQVNSTETTGWQTQNSLNLSNFGDFTKTYKLSDQLINGFSFNAYRLTSTDGGTNNGYINSNCVYNHTGLSTGDCRKLYTTYNSITNIFSNLLTTCSDFNGISNTGGLGVCALSPFYVTGLSKFIAGYIEGGGHKHVEDTSTLSVWIK